MIVHSVKCEGCGLIFTEFCHNVYDVIQLSKDLGWVKEECPKCCNNNEITTLGLTKAELFTLVTILYSVGGSPNNTLRMYADSLYDKLDPKFKDYFVENSKDSDIFKSLNNAISFSSTKANKDFWKTQLK